MVYNITIFGIHLNINPVAFTLPIGGGWEIRWYGIIIAFGFLLALLYAFKYAGRFNINLDRALDVVIVTTPVAILGARIYYILFDGERLDGISGFFGGGHSGFSGLAIYGGVISAAICGALMCYIRKVNILDMFDLASMGFLIGQGVGRWGNFTNQEAFGGPTGSSFFGMTSQNVVSDFLEKGYDSNALAHPCFLYESIWCITGFFVIHRLSKNRRFSGETALMYGVWYGFGRAVIEHFRTDSLMLGAFKVSSIVSIVLCLTCAVLLAVIRKRVRLCAGEGDYVPMISPPDTQEDEAFAEYADASDEAPGQSAEQDDIISETAEENAEATGENTERDGEDG